MPAATACPDVHDLERLLLGDVAAGEAEHLEEHVATCVSCSTRVTRLRAEDSLVEAVRAARSRGTTEDAPKGVEALMEKLKRLRAPGTETPTEAPTQIPVEPGQAEAIDYGFLAPPEQPDELGRLGGYRVLSVLGAGGMGVVFLAEDVQLQRRVALKVMQPMLAAVASARQRFLREARAAAALRHDHVVSLFQVGEDRGVPFLAMELLEGESLEDRLQRETCLDIAEGLRIGREIAHGLDAAHQRGLIHRDIKPGNVWLEAGTGRVKIVDFGLARAAGDKPGLTQQGAIVGTPQYMAPEQANSQPVDARCDLFSLGCVLYRTLTGHQPFNGNDAISTLMAVATETPPAPHVLDPEIPPALSGLVMRLLAKKPDERPASASEVAGTLQQMADASAPRVQATAQPRDENTEELRALPQPRPPRKWFAVAAALLLALGSLGYFFGGTVIRFATNQGELVIEVNDADVEVVIRQNSAELTERTKQRTFVLTAGRGEVEVYEKNGGIKLATKQFTLTRGGKTTVSVTTEVRTARTRPIKFKTQPSADPDRRAAEWVLRLGGQVYVLEDGQKRLVEAAGDLPPGRFALLLVHLEGKRPADLDAGLECLTGLKALEHLNLSNTSVTDRGVGYLRDLPALKRLNLHDTRVTDEGMKAVGRLHGLEELFLFYLPITDDGLAELRGLTGLRVLIMPRAKITDGGLKHLAGLKKLESLGIGETAVTDAGLAELSGLPELRHLALAGPELTGSGLQRLHHLPNLHTLQLYGTGVTDQGLAAVTGLKALHWLQLDIVHQVTDDGLKHVAGMTHLQVFRISSNRVTNAGLAHLKKLDRLMELRIGCPLVDDAGLEHLAGLWQLGVLDLSGSRLTGADFKHLQKMGRLQGLHLAGCPITDEGLRTLPELRELHTLALDRTRVTDAGLASLEKRVGLKEVTLVGTPVTDAGLRRLQKALPDCRIISEPETDTGPDRRVAEWVLSLKGQVHGLAGGKHFVAHPGDRLPSGPFQVVLIELTGNLLVETDDDDLRRFRELRGLRTLKLFDFSDLTDRGVRFLQDLAELESLTLQNCRLTDKGLESLKGLTALRALAVGGTEVSDAGLAVLRRFKRLSELDVGRTRVTNAGLNHLRDLNELTHLFLYDNPITDEGLAHLSGLTRLKRLNLVNTRVSDAGLEHLKKLTKLEQLFVKGTEITAEGVRKLQAALPQCTINTESP